MRFSQPYDTRLFLAVECAILRPLTVLLQAMSNIVRIEGHKFQPVLVSCPCRKKYASPAAGADAADIGQNIAIGKDDFITILIENS